MYRDTTKYRDLSYDRKKMCHRQLPRELQLRFTKIKILQSALVQEVQKTLTIAINL